MQWMEKFLGDQTVCELCLKDPTSHSHIPIGIETIEQSSILYGCPARATHSEVDPIVLHVSLQLEYCYALPQTGSRWIWCVDYNGFGLKEALQGNLAAKFGVLFNDHMPERLHKILLLNPPSVFRILLQAAKPFVDQRTLQKIIPVTGSTKVVIETLREQHAFPDPALSWLEQTLKQKLPNQLPALPNDSRALMLPSMVPVHQFVDPPMPSTTKEQSTSCRPIVRATSLVRGFMDGHNEVSIAN